MSANWIARLTNWMSQKNTKNHNALRSGGPASGSRALVHCKTYLFGNGIQASEHRKLPVFDTVLVRGQAVVQCYQDETTSVNVKCDQNLLEHVYTDVSDGVLHIDVRPNMETNKPVTIMLITRCIARVDASDTSSVFIHDLDGETVELIASQQATIRAVGQAKHLIVTEKNDGYVDADDVSVIAIPTKIAATTIQTDCVV